MSGPVTSADCPPEEALAPTGSPGAIEVLESRASQVGSLTVRRALPRRTHRTVGAWCFADHMGPVAVTEDRGVDIGPHPHIGLQTVTWLVAGEILHRDSLGSEQVVRAGQLNLMTAGRGVAHAEEATGRYRGDLHGIQLWVAQPEATRNGDPAFEHHAELPSVELDHGLATVVVGELGGVRSPARRDTDHVGAELDLRPGPTVVPIHRDHEHAVIVLDGAADVDGTLVVPGQLAYLGTGRDELALVTRDRSRVMLLGGQPFESPIRMWWNFVARTDDEMAAARQSWEADDGRFAPVHSHLPRTPAPALD